MFFMSQGKVYEIYARSVSQSHLFAFVEVEGLIFGERANLVVDPAEEHLKAEFSGVERTYLPLSSVLRIDEVEKEGIAKVIPGAKREENVSFLPPFFSPPKPPKPD